MSEYPYRRIIFRTVETPKFSGEGGSSVVFLNSVCCDRKGKRITLRPNGEGIHLLMFEFCSSPSVRMGHLFIGL